MVKSFLRIGSEFPSLAVRTSLLEPPKNFESVKIDKAEAPAL
jgi:hypothetical protein